MNEKFSNNAQNGIQVVQMQNFQNFAPLEQN
jgi:hypothetical protein